MADQKETTIISVSVLHECALILRSGLLFVAFETIAIFSGQYALHSGVHPGLLVILAAGSSFAFVWFARQWLFDGQYLPQGMVQKGMKA